MTPQSHPCRCHRHPAARVTGFCALCLRERLAGILPDDTPRSTLSDLFSRSPTSQPHPRVSRQDTKTVKEFIDLELQRRRRSAARDSGTFWNAAAQRLRKWKWKHASSNKGDSKAAIGNVEKRKARRLRDTQSEIGDCNLGRRSCDTDPRFSVDAGRVSFDCPRASWDGCLIGKSCSRLSSMEEDSNDSGGLESSGGGRTSLGFDRSNSRRRKSIAGVDDLKLMSNANANANGNAKVSPATFYGAKLLITEKELMDSYGRPSSDVVQSDSVVESDSKDVVDVANGVRQKGFKKLHKWRGVWNKLGLVHRKEEKSEDSESKGSVLNGRQEFMFQRNRSVRYSPNNPDTGLLRFYLTPSKSYKRSKAGRSSVKDLNSVARSGL
uniref:Uncharacterized protein n=1 Tax=Cajanus cajan TaxID=3821 RepID=A0A151RS38_CAJCA|nr:hypothetical protein KK1_033134 [Cajanus cajan]